MNKKSNIRKVLAVGALTLGGVGIMMTGIGMAQQVSAAPAQNEQTTQTQNQGRQKGRPELTDAQKTSLDKARTEAIASLSSEEQNTLKTLNEKGHFALTFAEREQFETINEKIRTYISEHPVEGMPTPPAQGGKRDGKKQAASTLTDAQKTELDRLKAEGIAQLSSTDQARLKELDTKDRMKLTDAENQELHGLQEKVRTYVKSKVSFTMPEHPKGGRDGQKQ